MSPTFVFVCGAWHPTAYFDPLIRTLSNADYASVAVVPRCLHSIPPSTSFQPDVDAVKEIIKALVGKGKAVIVVLHSYGGAVGTEAVGDLIDSKPEYAAKIKRLVHLTTMFPAPGQTITESVAGLGPAQASPNEAGNIILPEAAIDVLYDGVLEPQRSTYASQVGAMPAAALSSYLSHFGWEHVPTTYVYATLDLVFSPIVQEFMVNTTRNRAALGSSRASVTPFSGPLGTFSVEAGHSLMLSKTEEVAGFLCKVAADG